MQTVMKEQLSIFDIPITTTQIKKKGLMEELSELASQYLIDSHYKKVIGIEKLDNCIRIYQPRQQYPIYCISMIDGSFYRYARKEEKI